MPGHGILERLCAYLVERVLGASDGLRVELAARGVMVRGAVIVRIAVKKCSFGGLYGAAGKRACSRLTGLSILTSSAES